MKKTKLLILLLLGLFLNTTNVHAETFQRTNVDNGKISISINSNKGYAGAIDATIKLTGNVSLSKIEWNQSLNDLAMRDYEYDKKSNTIRIILVTKNTDQNLLDQSGNLKIGNLVVTSNKTEDFNVELSNLSMTNLDLAKTEIKSDNITSTGDKSFTITLQNTNAPSSTTKPSATTKPSSTTNPSKSDDSQNKDNKNENNDDLNKDNTTDDKNDEDNNKDDGTNNDNKNQDSEKNDKDTNKKDNEKMTVALIICGALLALVILISVIIYIVKRNRNLDDIVESQIIEKD